MSNTIFFVSLQLSPQRGQPTAMATSSRRRFAWLRDTLRFWFATQCSSPRGMCAVVAERPNHGNLEHG